MKGFCVVMAVLLQMAVAGAPPPQCRGPPPGVVKPHECCKVPSVFKEEDFESCEFKKREGPPPEGPPEMGGPHGGPGGPHDCSKELCLLKKYNVVKDDDTIDKEAMGKVLAGFSGQNPDFQPAVEMAQAKCLDSDLKGPPEICEAHKIMFCMTTVLFANCPASLWQDTDNCSTLKKHMDECAPFFLNDS